MKEKKFKSREALIEESLNEFCEFSYENASLNRIMKNAKVSKGSFYYHFKHKEDLYLHLLKKSIETKWIAISEYMESHSADFENIDIFDKFFYQAKAGLLFAQAHTKYNQLANMFAKEKGNEIYDNMLKIIGKDENNILSQLVDDAYQSKELDPSYDRDFVERLLTKLFENYHDFFSETVALEEKLKNLEEFVRFLRNGLGAKK
ncbi:MAG: TetR/AcrR family transcriptional regulator [Eubacteriales bacterium]